MHVVTTAQIHFSTESTNLLYTFHVYSLIMRGLEHTTGLDIANSTLLILFVYTLCMYVQCHM